MIKGMTYIAEHLSNLRQEITDLRNMNAKYSNKSEHGALDQSALETRTNRLREIKQELSTMLERPTDPKVWWEKLRKTTPIG
jgi:chromosome segregation ATPase